MELWLLGIGACALSLAILYSSHVESKRIDAIDKNTKGLRSELDGLPSKLDTRFLNVESGRRELQAKYNQVTNFNADISLAVTKLTKEFEIMNVRQRSLEKKIIEANRTVNLVFGKPIPMQVERVDTPIVRQKKGRGKSALFHHA